MKCFEGFGKEKSVVLTGGDFVNVIVTKLIVYRLKSKYFKNERSSKLT